MGNVGSRHASRRAVSEQIRRSILVGAGPRLPSMISKEVIKWNIAVLANGVVTRSEVGGLRKRGRHPTRRSLRFKYCARQNDPSVGMHLGPDRRVSFLRPCYFSYSTMTSTSEALKEVIVAPLLGD